MKMIVVWVYIACAPQPFAVAHPSKESCQQAVAITATMSKRAAYCVAIDVPTKEPL